MSRRQILRDGLQALRDEHVYELDVAGDRVERGIGSDAPRTPGVPPSLPRRWAAGLALAWLVLFTLAASVEPEAADPDAAPAVGAALSVALLGAWVAMAAGLARRHRTGATASLAASGVFLTMAAACPLSGHHGAVGAWWAVQLGAAAVLLALSAAALRRGTAA